MTLNQVRQDTRMTSGSVRPRDVLVSSTVKDLEAGSGLRFEDRGEHQLKGIPEAWHLFALTG